MSNSITLETAVIAACHWTNHKSILTKKSIIDIIESNDFRSYSQINGFNPNKIKHYILDKYENKVSMRWVLEYIFENKIDTAINPKFVDVKGEIYYQHTHKALEMLKLIGMEYYSK